MRYCYTYAALLYLRSTVMLTRHYYTYAVLVILTRLYYIYANTLSLYLLNSSRNLLPISLITDALRAI